MYVRTIQPPYVHGVYATATMASPKKTEEITQLTRELTVHGMVFYVTANNTRMRSGPDIILPSTRGAPIAIWMQRENPLDGHDISKGQATQQAALRAAGWQVLLPHGCRDALRQLRLTP
jgi:hypothetical protein